MLNFQTTSAIAALAASTLPSLPALADVIQTQYRLQPGAPNGTFDTGLRLSFQSGDLADDVLAMFQQTQTWGMSEQMATLRLQTTINTEAGFVSTADVNPGGRFATRNWTLNVFMFDANTFDPLDPYSSLVSQQSILTTSGIPQRAGTVFNTSRAVHEMTYSGIVMPVLAEGSSPRTLLIAFAPEEGIDGSTRTIFGIPMSLIPLDSPQLLVEGTNDFRYNTITDPYSLTGFAPRRIPLAFEINSVPSPGTALLGLGALAVAAGSRRRREE